MINYGRYLKLMDDYSEEKLKNKIICNWYGNTFLILFLVIFLVEFMYSFLFRYNYQLYILFYVLLLLIMFGYLVTRKAGFGITENRIVYVKFKHLGIKINKFEEVPFEKIRNINVRKFLGVRMIFISYISSQGKLEKVKIYFPKKYFGFNSDEIMNNRKEIVNKLEEMQKVLDRGDF